MGYAQVSDVPRQNEPIKHLLYVKTFYAMASVC